MQKNLKKYSYLLIVLICIIGIYIVTNYESEKEVVLEENKSFEETISKEEVNNVDEESICDNKTFYVDIKGEVKNPGVYEVDSNKRVMDVVSMAGGFTKDADTTILNLSKKVKDEMTILIYSKKEIENVKNSLISEPQVVEVIKEVEKIVEVEKECLCEQNDICISENEMVIDTPTKDSNEIKDMALININTATKEELMTLNGIGESKALKIIEYRENNKFEKIEDIMNISGIGNAMFEKIKEHITV